MPNSGIKNSWKKRGGEKIKREREEEEKEQEKEDRVIKLYNLRQTCCSSFVGIIPNSKKNNINNNNNNNILPFSFNISNIIGSDVVNLISSYHTYINITTGTLGRGRGRRRG